MEHLECDLYFYATHILLLLRNIISKKKHITINNIKLNLVKKYYALSCQKTFKISRAIVQETSKMLSVTEILSASTVKRLLLEQGRFL